MRVRAMRAFTLVELLIAVGVIGILMGVLLPVTRSVRATARATVCRGNLKQMGHALSLYIDDYSEYIPRRGQGSRKLWRISRMADWFNGLLPYVDSLPYRDLYAQGTHPQEGDSHVLICPAARDPGWTHFLPCTMNMYLSPWHHPSPHTLSELPSPAVLVFMADSPGPYSSTLPSRHPYGVVPRHSGSANILYLDSHVRAYDGAYLGCGRGDPGRGDVRWATATPHDEWEPGE